MNRQAKARFTPAYSAILFALPVSYELDSNCMAPRRRLNRVRQTTYAREPAGKLHGLVFSIDDCQETRRLQE